MKTFRSLFDLGATHMPQLTQATALRSRFSGVARSVAVVGALLTASSMPAEARDGTFERPFGPNSIWNTPIGSGAQFSSNQIFPDNPNMGVYEDPTVIVRATDADRVVPVYIAGTGNTLDAPMRFPDRVVATSFRNGLAAVLQPDGTLRQYNYFFAFGDSQNRGTSAVAKWQGAPVSINDNGVNDRFGAQGGSQLSTMGGVIRTGELTGSNPIGHVLKLEIPLRVVGYFNRTGTQQGPVAPNTGYRWPAAANDSYAFQDPRNDPGSGGYSGSDPQLTMGSLLAIPRTNGSGAAITADSLGLQTGPGRKIFQALQDYGAYVPDDSDANVVQFVTERGDGDTPSEGQMVPTTGLGPGVRGELVNVGLKFAKTGDSGDLDPQVPDTLSRDILKMLPFLRVVTNNGPSSVGGGSGDPNVNIPNDTYRISTRDTPSRALTSDTSVTTGSGADVINAEYTGAANQKWQVTHQGGGWYRISPTHSPAQGLDVGDAATGVGASVIQWEFGGGPNQLWRFQYAYDGFYRLTPQHAQNRCMEAESNLQLGDYRGAPQQLWSLTRVTNGGTTPSPTPSASAPIGKRIALRARANSLFVSAPNGGSSALIANSGSNGGAEQQFDVLDGGSGYIALRAVVNGQLVCAENEGSAPLIANRGGTPGAWEQFTWINNSNGSISLRARANNQVVCADNSGNSPLIANRAGVGGAWEEFDFVDLGNNDPSPTNLTAN